MKRKKRRIISMLCLFSIVIGLSANVEAATPDAPNFKTISSLWKGDSVFFANMEWIVLNPSTGKLITREPFKQSAEYDTYEDLLLYLNSTFFNTLQQKDRDLILTKTENGITARVFLPSGDELKNLNEKAKYLLTSDDYSCVLIKGESGGIGSYRYRYQIRKYDRDESDYDAFRYNHFYAYWDEDINSISYSWYKLNPTVYIDPKTKVIDNSDKEGISLVIGGKFNLDSPKGVTNKFYFYDRYLLETKFDAKEGEDKNVGFVRWGGTESTIENYFSTILQPCYSEYEFINNRYGPITSREGNLRWDRELYYISSNGTEKTKYGWRDNVHYTNGDRVYWHYKYWSKRLCVAIYNPTKGSQAGSYFLGKDNQYPINGAHTDGYWYVRREEADMDGLGEVTIDNLSEELKHDIMPVINVEVGENFNEVVPGRTYITDGSTSNGVILNQWTTNEGNKYITLTGKFNTEGVRLVTIPDKNDSSKKVYFLFNVIKTPVAPSARGITLN